MDKFNRPFPDLEIVVNTDRDLIGNDLAQFANHDRIAIWINGRRPHKETIGYCMNEAEKDYDGLYQKMLLESMSDYTPCGFNDGFLVN